MDNGRNRHRGVDALFSNGRLTAVPRKVARRRELLEHLAGTLFDTGREYGESEVNERLGRVYDDHAALRRYLVTEGLLRRSRDGRAYWRDAPADAAA
ncbi:DUF2087 domain-containing protein [Streptomyces sp. NPDC003691]